MAAKKKKAKKAKKSASRKKKLDPIISKSRTKAAVSCKVASDFYEALDNYVRVALAAAEERCAANKRSTLRPQDL